MEISTARTVSVLVERLIIANLAGSDTRAKMQHLGDAVDLAVDRRDKSTRGERQILIPGEAGKERSVSSRRKTLAENARRQPKVLGIVHGGEADLPLDIPGIDKRRTLHGIDEAIAGFIFERVEGLEIADSQEQRFVGDFETFVLEIGVLHSDRVVGEIDFDNVFPVVPNYAFDAEAGTTKLGARDIGKAGDGRVLIDVVVIHLESAADLELELLAVAAGKFRRALPLDLEVEVAGAGFSRRRLGRGGLRLGILYLLLQRLDGRLHTVDLGLDRLQILRIGCWNAGSQNPDSARTGEQIAAQSSQSPNHVPLHLLTTTVC